MRLMLKAAFAALALATAPSGVAYAQGNNCPVTTTTSTGPNGETITRREACGAVEITSTGGRPPTTTPSNRPTTNTPPANRPNNTPPANTGGGHMTPQLTAPTTSVMTIPGRNPSAPTSFPNASSGMSSIPHGGAGGYTPPGGMDPMAMQRPMARIVLYDNANLRGRNIGITVDTPNLQRRRFADLASGVRAQGGVWELCSEPNYGGACITTAADMDLDAAGIGNTVASVRLVRE